MARAKKVSEAETANLAIVKHMFDTFLKEYHVKDAMVERGYQRTDDAFGHLLGIKVTTEILLGDEHELSQYMKREVANLINRERKSA